MTLGKLHVCPSVRRSKPLRPIEYEANMYAGQGLFQFPAEKYMNVYSQSLYVPFIDLIRFY